MMRLVISAGLALCVGVPVHASVCDLRSIGSSEQHSLQGQPFWMTIGGNYLSYNTTDYKGHLYDLNTRRRNTLKAIDATPLAEGDLYLLPRPLGFYRTDKSPSQQPVATDPAMPGDYQSLGDLGKKDGNRQLRVLIGMQEGYIRDYAIKKTDDSYDIQPIGAPKRLCPKIAGAEGLGVQTPMLSRDGTMVSAVDPRSMETKIWKIDPQNATCSLVRSLKTQTSKAVFSFDNRKILYTAADASGRTRLIETDIRSGRSKIISTPREHVLYHTYKPDGTILYARENPDDRGNSTLVGVRPGTIVEGDRAERVASAIGYAWGETCGQANLNADEARALGSRLTPESCRELLSSMQRPVGGGVTTAEMRSFCGGTSGSGSSPSDSNR